MSARRLALAVLACFAAAAAAAAASDGPLVNLEWIPGVGWQPEAGTPNDNLTLFDFSGRALPGVSFADPARACAQYAPALPGACARAG